VGVLRYGTYRRRFEKAKGLIQVLRAIFWKNAIVLGENEELNQSLEKAGRVADFP